MKNSFYILALFILVSGCQKEVQPKGVVQQSSVSYMKSEAFDASVALKFINDYVGFLDKKPEDDILKWIAANTDVTDGFKIRHKQIINEAREEDPELVLGFDPVLDAQDNPEEFELESVNEKTGLLVVKGKDWEDFKLAMKIKNVEGKWKVDGCGIINIPEGMRPAR